MPAPEAGATVVTIDATVTLPYPLVAVPLLRLAPPVSTEADAPAPDDAAFLGYKYRNL